jgi:cbb3-type cytochrome oxidase cytochrome c subunit
VKNDPDVKDEEYPVKELDELEAFKIVAELADVVASERVKTEEEDAIELEEVDSVVADLEVLGVVVDWVGTTTVVV